MGFHDKFAVGCLAVFALALSLFSAQTNGLQFGKQLKPDRDGFDLLLTNLIDFNRFKEIFHKSYNSLIEELARRKLFMVRVINVFVAAIRYKRRRSSSYLSINHMSDWTPDEFKQTLMKPSSLGELIEPTKLGMNSEILENVANEKSVHDEIRNREISDLPVTELNGEREAEITPGQRHEDTVISNNIEYQRPALTANLIGDTGASVDSNEQMFSLLKILPTSNYFASLLKFAADLLAPQQTDITLETKKFPSNIKEYEDTDSDTSKSIHIDHTKSDCLFEVRNQGRCGSCYAFVTMALYEWHYCKSTGKHVAFSEQYIIDCGERVGLRKCLGGRVNLVSDFVNQYGLELRQHYPYRKREDSCPYEPSTPAHSMGYLRIYDSGFELIKLANIERELAKAPMIINLAVNDQFQEYGGGVDAPFDCDKEGGLHSLLLVGSGREDGDDYWLLRNSYGPDWGLAGNYKMSKRVSQLCFDPVSGITLRNLLVPLYVLPRDVSNQVKTRYNEYVESDLKMQLKRKETVKSSGDFPAKIVSPARNE